MACAPDTFDELMAKLYASPRNSYNRYRSDFVYRGLDVSTWGLETSLQRLGPQYPEVEGPLLRNFIKYSVDRDLARQSLLYKLAFAQHHGLPTRVLDWSTAPKVALHFAVGDENHYDKDGIIWAVNVTAIHKLLPLRLTKILDVKRAFVFSVDMLDQIVDLDDLKKMKKTFSLFFEPPSLDGRIVNQGAILSLMPDPTSDMKKELEKDPNLFECIIIRKELKWEIRDKLDQDQINERMLFPGEDGTARWLKRYYGPGPNKTGHGSAPPIFTGPMKGP